MKKSKLKPKKLQYLDYECKVGERVCWENLQGNQFEGVITEWLENLVAVIKLDDNSTIEVKC